MIFCVLLSRCSVLPQDAASTITRHGPFILQNGEPIPAPPPFTNQVGWLSYFIAVIKNSQSNLYPQKCVTGKRYSVIQPFAPRRINLFAQQAFIY